MQGKAARIWRAFGGERDNSRPKEQIPWTKSGHLRIYLNTKRIYLNACAGDTN